MILDTDVLIWGSRGNPRATEALRKHQGFHLSVVTYMEIVQGIRNKHELAAFKQALLIWSVKILQITESISQHAMFLVERYGLSHSLTPADALIAATAIQYREPLLTSNTKHYAAIPDLRLVRFTP